MFEQKVQTGENHLDKHTISSMKYVARLRGDKKRLKELEERYEQLRKLRDEWRKAQHESRPKPSKATKQSDAQKSSIDS